jgi:hypothetical protein
MNTSQYMTLKMGNKYIFKESLQALKSSNNSNYVNNNQRNNYYSPNNYNNNNNRRMNPKRNYQGMDVIPKFIANQNMQEINKELLDRLSNKKVIFNKMMKSYFSEGTEFFTNSIREIENQVMNERFSVESNNNRDYEGFKELISFINSNRTNPKLTSFQNMSLDEYKVMNNETKNQIMEGINQNKPLFQQKLKLKYKNENVNNNNFNDKLFISSNICEVNIIQETPKNKELQLDISSNICEINVLKEETPKIFLNELISICSNTCEINIPSKEKEEEESKKSLNDKFLENLEIISNIAEICFIPEKNEKNQNLEILSKICEINIISSVEKKKDGFAYLSISKNINELNIISDKTKDNNQELTIVSKTNEINILVDNSQKKSSISQNENKNEQINQILEISSNICEINIIQKKEPIFNISENEHFEFVEVRKRKKEKKIKTDKAIFQSYINTLNIGFDNGQEYDNYNAINKEKDEDSDNENDRLECEPVPSFILCIQKKENQKREKKKKAN